MSMLTFEPTKTITVTNIESFKSLQEAVISQISSINRCYAFRAKGSRLCPLAPDHSDTDEDVDLLEYLGSRQMFDLTYTEGTIVCIHTPDCLGMISIPDLHFHFENRDNTVGDHLEDIRFDRMDFEIEDFDRIDRALPSVPQCRSKKMQIIQPPSGAGSGETAASRQDAHPGAARLRVWQFQRKQNVQEHPR